MNDSAIFDLLARHYLSMRVQPHETQPPASPRTLWTAYVNDDRVVGRGCGSASYETPGEAIVAALESFAVVHGEATVEDPNTREVIP